LIKGKLSPKMEDYLEAISFIEEKREVARRYYREGVYLNMKNMAT